MVKKKESKKAHILVESDLSPLNTKIYVVNPTGKKTLIPNVISAEWKATAGKVCTLKLRTVGSVSLKIEQKNTVKEEKMVDSERPYCYDEWISQLGAQPLRELAEDDRSADYEIDRAMVWELENGKFATIFECGCSCYDSSDAAIEVYNTEAEAMKSFNDWKG